MSRLPPSRALASLASLFELLLYLIMVGVVELIMEPPSVALVKLVLVHVEKLLFKAPVRQLLSRPMVIMSLPFLLQT